MASGLQLQLLVVFKGVRIGRIAWEFVFCVYVIGPIYVCQQNAQMDKECKCGFDEKFQSYLVTALKNVVPLLILTAILSHDGSVIHMIQDFGMWVQHIP